MSMTPIFNTGRRMLLDATAGKNCVRKHVWQLLGPALHLSDISNQFWKFQSDNLYFWQARFFVTVKQKIQRIMNVARALLCFVVTR